MNQITIMYPTRNRIHKLLTSIESVFAPDIPETPIEIVVVCDGDKLTAGAILDYKRVARLIYVRDHKGSVYARNLISQTTEGNLICAVDDITFYPEAIDEAAAEMRRSFPDTDGVVGFRRADRDHTKLNKSSGMYGGVALIGQKFLQRYPNRKICFPGYFLFAAQEMTNLAVKVGKGVIAEKAKIFHHSPRKGGDIDQTHLEGRQYKRRDADMRRARAKCGLLWGWEMEGFLYDRTMGIKAEETERYLKSKGIQK